MRHGAIIPVINRAVWGLPSEGMLAAMFGGVDVGKGRGDPVEGLGRLGAADWEGPRYRVLILVRVRRPHVSGLVMK